MKHILWWLRRDLRIDDNLVLHQALNDAASVIPVFILDEKLLTSKKLAPARIQFLFESLAALDANLKTRGAYLVLRKGDAARELVKLARETQADAIYFHADYTPYARRRDARVMAELDKVGIRYAAFNDLYLADPNEVLKEDGTPYTVYTPYRKRFEKIVSIPPRYETKRSLNTPREIPSLHIESLMKPRNPNFARGGEDVANELAQEFVTRKNGLEQYGNTRDDMAADSTSHLSPHLHFGTMSVRELVRMARTAHTLDSRVGNGAANAKVWINELVWREFLNQVMFHFPHAARQSFRPEYKDLDWQANAKFFDAWREGKTGYPIVDAGMRQLKQTGWMHNRARMISASFLTKDLLLNWQLGEKFFLQTLIDGDVASNNGGWQWAAGTGTDAQPYFRIFNPMLQSARFDSAGTYIRRWVPELERVPTQYIHAPWEMPDETARAIGFCLDKEYPCPMVDHAVQRDRALAFYRQNTQRAQIKPQLEIILRQADSLNYRRRCYDDLCRYN